MKIIVPCYTWEYITMTPTLKRELVDIQMTLEKTSELSEGLTYSPIIYYYGTNGVGSDSIVVLTDNDIRTMQGLL